ncbi:MAG: hypothetical protein U9N35_00155 [Euryarchaeota archaeon]|nr:hypothetical protein [Euryarchaeota archaeon]
MKKNHKRGENEMNKKLLSLFVAAVFLVATLGTVSAEEQKRVTTEEQILKNIAIVDLWIERNPSESIPAYAEAKKLLKTSKLCLEENYLKSAELRVDKAIEIIENTFVPGKTKTITQPKMVRTMGRGDAYLVVGYQLSWTPYEDCFGHIAKVVWEYEAYSELHNGTPW